MLKHKKPIYCPTPHLSLEYFTFEKSLTPFLIYLFGFHFDNELHHVAKWQFLFTESTFVLKLSISVCISMCYYFCSRYEVSHNASAREKTKKKSSPQHKRCWNQQLVNVWGLGSFSNNIHIYLRWYIDIKFYFTSHVMI